MNILQHLMCSLRLTRPACSQWMKDARDLREFIKRSGMYVCYRVHFVRRLAAQRLFYLLTAASVRSLHLSHARRAWYLRAVASVGQSPIISRILFQVSNSCI